MSIEHRGENKWRFRVTKNGKKFDMTYYSTTIPKTKNNKVEVPKEVQSEHDAFKVDIQRDKIFSEEKMKLNDLYDLVDKEYFKTKLSASTQETYESAYNEHVRDIFGDCPINAIKKIDIQKLINQKTKTHAARTVRIIYGVISRLYTKANDWGITEINPCSCVDLPSIPKTRYEQLLSNAEISKLLLAYDKDPNTMHKLAFSLAIGCGMRIGEILALKVDDFDFKNNSITINKQHGKVKNAEGKTYRAEKTTKTANSIRKIYAPDFVMETAKDHIKQMKPMPINRKIFWCNELDKIIYQDFIRKYFKQVLKDNFIKDIRFHDLRHLKATIMLNTGANAVTVARTLGDSIDTVLNNYTHTIDEVEIKSAKEFDNYISKAKAH